MKKYVFFSLLSLVLSLFIGCDESSILEETPIDFFSTSNAYSSINDFEIALNGLYAQVRYTNFGPGDLTNNFAYFLGTDIAFDARKENNLAYFGKYSIHVIPSSAMVEYHWKRWYKTIADANTIINRIDHNDEIDDSDKNRIKAEAIFFRGISYRYLVYLYGGVPLLVHEIDSPKTDFTRASRNDILTHIVSDLEFAGKYLPNIEQVEDGKISNLVAWHYLAETYLALENFDLAIEYSSKVIDNPNMELMRERFGSRVSEPGDVFWDLFRRDNQNRSSGNKESLWVIQMETDVPGGFLSSTARSVNTLERYANPVAFLTYLDPDGNEGMTGLQYSNMNIGGRGASFMQNTDYFLYDLWEDDWDDMRNSDFNIVRDIKYNNPESVWFDSSAVKYPSPTWINQNWRWYPWLTKTTTPGNHPDNSYEDKSEQILKSSVGSTYRDMYMLRLPETILVRAEAFLKSDNLNQAANDINLIRSRANADEVNPEDVSLNLILDERARELVYEEPRRITLGRLGNLVERVNEFNEWHQGDIQDYNELWPIPLKDIEANSNANLEQNPGY